MACAGDKIDHTANLPDEVLHLVLSYLPLHDKLRVESVSRRFQRCVLDLMKREPQPLELKTCPDFLGRGNSLNGYNSTESGRLVDALRSLANKAKFNEVKIDFDWLTRTRIAELNGLIDTLLGILLESDSDCLDKVVSFECKYGPSHKTLEKVIAKCVKLSTVRFDFLAREPPIPFSFPDPIPVPMIPLPSPEDVDVDLNRVLNAKALTQLHLRLTAYPQERLIQLFHSLKPQTLQKLSLLFSYEMPTLDLPAMVKQLNTNAWAALQEMNLCWETSAGVHLVPFFQSLSLLPALETCHVRLHHIQPTNQFVAAMAVLFNSDLKLTLSSEDGFLLQNNMPDCQVMALIRQLQKMHPSVGVDFYLNHHHYDALYLTLSNGTGLFEEEANPHSCGDADCVDCQRFYPSVLTKLGRIAFHFEDIHLHHYQLDKCRIDTVVECLNYELLKYYEEGEAGWRALTAEANDAEDLVTISFVTIEEYDEDQEPHHFEVTVACGPCFSGSCIRCVNVE